MAKVKVRRKVQDVDANLVRREGLLEPATTPLTPCIREFGGETWHQVATVRKDGTNIAVCGARIRDPFRNAHPGHHRCVHCFEHGYPGDGVSGNLDDAEYS